MKKSSIERIMGSAPESKKEALLKSIEEVFNNQIFEELEGKEREKTPEELQIIDLVNKITNEIRRKYGLENFDIPPKNIHVIKEEDWSEKGTDAFYRSGFQGVVMREQQIRISFARKVFHEMLHFKSYNVLQIIESEDSEMPEIADYRSGLGMGTVGGKKMRFSSLDEAVNEEIVKRYVLQHSEDLSRTSVLAPEIKQIREIISKYRNAKTESGKSLFDDDIFYIQLKESPADKKTADITTFGFPYKQERLILNVLINKLLKHNTEKFKDNDAIFELFVRGKMTGNILPMGRLIDGTFGKGTLRKIGELDKDLEAQKRFVDSLR